MTKVSTLLLYYCTLIALFLSVSGFLTSQSTEGVIYQLLFLPITLYFVISVLRNLKSKTLDVNLSGKTAVMIIFLVIFAILTVVAIKNILSKRALNDEQIKSSQSIIMPDNSAKDNGLIFEREAE